MFNILIRLNVDLTKLPNLKVGTYMNLYCQSGIIKGEPACLEATRTEKKIVRQFSRSEDGVFIVSSSEAIRNSDGKIASVVTRVHDMTDFFEIRDDIENVRLIMEKLAKSDGDISQLYGADIVAMNPEFCEVLERGKKVAVFVCRF